MKALLLLATLFSVNAQAASAISCLYPSGSSGELAQLSLTAPAGVDLADPSSSGFGGPFQKTQIPLTVNGQPAVYNVKSESTRAALTVTYWVRGEFFINDIAIELVTDSKGATSVSGTWTTDYSTIALDCKVD